MIKRIVVYKKMHILFRQNPGISELCNGFMNDVQSTNIISDLSVASPWAYLCGGFKYFLFKVGLKLPTSGTWFLPSVWAG